MKESFRWVMLGLSPQCRFRSGLKIFVVGVVLMLSCDSSSVVVWSVSICVGGIYVGNNVVDVGGGGIWVSMVD